MAQLGFRTLQRDDRPGRPARHARAPSTTGRPSGVDLVRSCCTRRRPSRASAIWNSETQDHGLDKALDHELIARRRAGAREAASRCGSSCRSATSTAPSAPCCRARWRRRYGHAGLPEDTISVRLTGTAGQSFGAFLARGVSLELTGDANDYVGKGLSGGRVVVRQPRRPRARPGGEHHRRQHRAVRRDRRRGLFRGRGRRALRGAQLRRGRGRRGHRRPWLRIHDRRRGGGAGRHRAQLRRRHVGRHRLCLRSRRPLRATVQPGDGRAGDGRRLPSAAPTDGRAGRASARSASRTAAWATCCASTPSGCASWSSGTICITGSARARELLEDWDAALRQFVKVMPTDYRRALHRRCEARKRRRPASPPASVRREDRRLHHGQADRVPRDRAAATAATRRPSRALKTWTGIRPCRCRRPSSASRRRAAWIAASRSATTAVRSTT